MSEPRPTNPPHPSPLPDPLLSVHYDSLHPTVRLYADNLKVQISQIFHQYHVPSYNAFRHRSLTHPHEVPSAALHTLQRLLTQLNSVLTHPEVYFYPDLPDLNDQYQSILKTLEDTNILDDHHEVTAIDNNPYPIPPESLILKTLHETPWIKEKIKQGFTQLSLVPIASIPTLAQTLRTQILKHHQEHTLFSSDGTSLELDTTNPLDLWNSITDTDLVYYPQEFSENHQGLTKQELLKQSLNTLFPGWEVLLTEPGDIPAQGANITIGGRKRLEANQTPNDYLHLLTSSPHYSHESGFTPEAWMIRFLHSLHTKNQVIDDWQGQGKICYLTGSFHPASGDLPRGCWYRDYRQASMDRVDPRIRRDSAGSRFAVRMGI